jgi:hypothetical protein
MGDLLNTYPVHASETKLNVSALPKGIYFLKVGKNSVKFVKQ